MAVNIANLDYGVDADGMAQLDSQFGKLLVDEICQDIEKTRTQVLTDLEDCWEGVAKQKFAQDFETYIQTLGNAINREYLDLQERLKDISYNYYTEDENIYSSPSV